MRIDHEFTVSVPVQRAWEVLTDLPGIAPCLPGARLTGVDGDVYSGEVTVKVGPVTSHYAGTARFVAKDDAARHAVIDAKGKDSRGSGYAAATIDAQLRPDGERTVVSVSTELAISGKVAQFGRGMITEISEKLMGQFVDNLEATLLVPGGAPQPATTAALDATGAAPAPPAPPAPAEHQPLDLMSVAGGSVYRRLVPVLVIVGVLVGLVCYLLTR